MFLHALDHYLNKIEMGLRNNKKRYLGEENICFIESKYFAAFVVKLDWLCQKEAEESKVTCTMATCKRTPLRPTAMEAAAMTAGPVRNLTAIEKAAMEFPHAIILGCKAMNRPACDHIIKEIKLSMPITNIQHNISPHCHLSDFYFCFLFFPQKTFIIIITSTTTTHHYPLYQKLGKKRWICRVKRHKANPTHYHDYTVLLCFFLILVALFTTFNYEKVRENKKRFITKGKRV